MRTSKVLGAWSSGYDVSFTVLNFSREGSEFDPQRAYFWCQNMDFDRIDKPFLVAAEASTAGIEQDVLGSTIAFY